MFINSPLPTIGRLFSDAVDDLNEIDENIVYELMEKIPYVYSCGTKGRAVGTKEFSSKNLPYIFISEFTDSVINQEYRTILRVLPVDMPSNLVDEKLSKTREEAKNDDAVFYYLDSLTSSFKRSK